MRSTPELLVADSFRVRVRNGRAEARAFERHLHRFETSAIETLRASLGDSWSEGVLDPFLREAPVRIAAGGAGFPRIELWEDGRFEVALRPMPPLGRSLDVVTAPARRRSTPWIKGPNIAHYARMNSELGGEALLLDARGRALEGATTSILWWEGSTLCAVAETSRVSSVTEGLLLEAARRDGRGTLLAEISAEDLAGREAWAVNALHGIRAVASVDGIALPDPDEDRLRSFRDALDRAWEPIV